MSLRNIQLITVLVLTAVPYVFWVGQSSALQFSDRSVTLSTATPSAVASQTFQMTPGLTAAVGSIVFEYCTNSPLFDISCVPPAGLSLSAAALTQQTGNTGFIIDTLDTNATRLVISRVPTATATVTSSYTFDNITNPSANNQTTFVRVSTYASTQGSGSYIDNGAMAFSTSTNFAVGAFVPPFINLCVGVTVAPNCAQASGDSLDLGVLSSQSTRSATSQFAGSTNDGSGYVAYILGTTMTSGNNVINAANNASPSRVGSSEFGVNLRKNTNPSVGSDPSGAGSAAPSGGYNVSDLFSFVPGSQIASSAASTDYNRMTVSYIANVPPGQPAGVYATTLTYLASAQF